VFGRHKVDGQRLGSLTASEVRGWGVSQREVNKLMSAIEILMELDEEEGDNGTCVCVMDEQ